MCEGKTLYKYRRYSAQSLAALVNRELYFASSQQLNDPFDCQLSIPEALSAAVAKADGMPRLKVPFRKYLRHFGKLTRMYEKFSKNWANIGVLSLSEVPDSSLMWTHYSDDHRGFCLGFLLEEPFTSVNDEHLIIGCTKVEYSDHNPFMKYFLDISIGGELPSFDELWKELFYIAIAAKSAPWSYEQEVRVLRKEPGVVPFLPRMLKDVIFGSRMPEESRVTLRRLLSTEEWKHVKFMETRKSASELSFVLVEA